jgi:hypothetical protein
MRMGATRRHSGSSLHAPRAMSGDSQQASEFLAQLRRTYGQSPHLSIEFVKQWLHTGASEDTIRAEYKELISMWREDAPEATVLFRRLRIKPGPCNNIRLDTVLKWMNEKWDNDHIETEYHRQRKEQVEKAQREAPGLFVNMNSRFGQYFDITESTVKQWLSYGCNAEQVEEKYRRRRRVKRRQIRAQRLRERILHELAELDNPTRQLIEINVSDAFLFEFFENGQSDEEIIRLFLSNQYPW